MSTMTMKKYKIQTKEQKINSKKKERKERERKYNENADFPTTKNKIKYERI